MTKHLRVNGRTYDITADGHIWALGAPAADVLAMRHAGYLVRC